jgi:LDH2 family malate/lactate/ureidoglycolate dehydrogenase
MMAIDINSFLPLEEFKRRMDAYVKAFKTCQPLPGIDEVLLPGEIERRRDASAQRNGVELPHRVYEECCQIGITTGMPLEEKAAG